MSGESWDVSDTCRQHWTSLNGGRDGGGRGGGGRGVTGGGEGLLAMCDMILG